MDLEKIKTLLEFAGRSPVSELTVREAGTTIIIRNHPRKAGTERAQLAPEPSSSPAAPSSEPVQRSNQTDARLVRSAVAGVIHQAASPGAAPLIAVGDLVEVGQALCIVEAMKVFTTVSASFGGAVKRIFFEDGQDVGFGDPLVEIA